MIRHPGGMKLTEELIERSEIKPCTILDMGAGSGETMRLLRGLNYSVQGIDLEEKEGIQEGDLTALPYEDECFEAVISECCFSICGNPKEAFKQAERVLKKGGRLLLSDVYFPEKNSRYMEKISHVHQYSIDEWLGLAKRAGFTIVEQVDKTSVWYEYYLERLWSDDPLPMCMGIKSGYFLLVCEKR